MREAVVHAVPVSRHPNDETIDGPQMCRKCTKRETGEMSGNAPRAVNQAVQKRVKNGGPQETLRTSRHHRLRPEVGEDWGQQAGGRRKSRAPKKPVESGAVKTAGVQQGGTKSDPATQVTGKGWLGGKKRVSKKTIKDTKTGSEKKTLGYRKRETWASK